MIRRLVWAAGFVATVVALAAAGLGVYVARTWDRIYDAPLPAIRLSSDPAVLARGECTDLRSSALCRMPRWIVRRVEKLSNGVHAPLSGGLRLTLGPLGAVHREPHARHDDGIGRYSDAQVARMMRWAVRPDGRATVDPMMPFGDMAEDDLAAIIPYLRAQPPVRNVVPANEWTLMGKVIKSFVSIAKPRKSINPAQTAPLQGMTKERGEYLARYVANCAGCHTPRDPNTFTATGPDFAGGFEMDPLALPGADPTVRFRTPNITPKTGGALMKFPDRETFIARFQKGGRHYAGSPMPWEAFARMTTEDIGALYEYLHSLEPHDGPTGEPTFKKSD